MSSTDPISTFEQSIQYRVTSELRAMLETTEDWIQQCGSMSTDDNDDLIWRAYRNAIEDELAERELEIETGEDQ